MGSFSWFLWGWEKLQLLFTQGPGIVQPDPSLAQVASSASARPLCWECHSQLLGVPQGLWVCRLVVLWGVGAPGLLFLRQEMCRDGTAGQESPGRAGARDPPQGQRGGTSSTPSKAPLTPALGVNPAPSVPEKQWNLCWKGGGKRLYCSLESLCEHWWKYS